MKRWLPLLILALGAVIFVVLLKTKPQAQQLDRPVAGILVEAQVAQSARHQSRVPAQGTVIPAQQVSLSTEVGGRVIWQSESLVPGGTFLAGQALFILDRRDYEIAVQQEQAKASKAQLELELEQGRKVVAEREWKLLNKNRRLKSDGPSAASSALALREPQLATATIAVEAAQSGLRRAQLNLERSTVRAPFNAFVREEKVDLGQVIHPQMTLGSLVGSDTFWVQVSLPLEWVASIQLPEGGQAGARATVWQEMGAQRVIRQGRVIQLLGEVDPNGRMARLLIEIDDPLGLQDPEQQERSLPLLLGSFVYVDIEGHAYDEAIEIPRIALREGNRVYVVNSRQELEIRSVEVAWRREHSVLVRSGLAAGDRVITSRIGTPIPGMALRVAGASVPVQAATEQDEKSNLVTQ